jgi:hypothetical protein
MLENMPMAGRPKTMARKLEQLQPYPWQLVEALSELVPKKYLGQRPGEKHEEIFPQCFHQPDSKTSEHTYLRPNGRVNYTFAVKHVKSGKVVQGWSAGGDATDALRDLARRAGLSADDG